MKKRIYNFTWPWASIFIIAYALLFALLITVCIEAANKTLPIIIICLLAASSLIVVWFFVILAVTVSKEGIKQGAKSIKMKDVTARVEYNERYREMQIVITDTTVRYDKLSRLEGLKHAFIFQASKRNLEIINGWLGRELRIPPKPPKKRFWKK
jgi:hypothetical protein